MFYEQQVHQTSLCLPDDILHLFYKAYLYESLLYSMPYLYTFLKSFSLKNQSFLSF
nr:MAG TPA: hypothetical protein [Caudoviricetes sp.]